MTLAPVYFETVDWVEEDVNLSGDAEDAFDSVMESGNNTMWILGPAFLVGYFVWSIMKMSEKERYTGVY